MKKKKQNFGYKYGFHADLNSKSCKPENGEIVTDLCKRIY